MSFQATANFYQAIGVSGDFASSNPRASVISQEGGHVAGTGGVIVARFGWVQADGKTVLNAGTVAPSGFLHREQQAVISTYLAESGNTVPAGFGITLMRTGDYFVTTATAATVGQKIFASTTDGSVETAAAAAVVSGFIETDFTVSRACLAGELTVMTL